MSSETLRSRLRSLVSLNLSEERCLSYNFLPIHGKEISICQLSDSDRFISGVNFTKEDGGIYRGIQVTILHYLREVVKNSYFDERECHPARFKCISFGANLLLSV